MLPLITLALSFASRPTPSDESGCFNFYSGSCTGCGQPRMCGYNPHTDTQSQSYAMPTFYTGNSPYCAHCPNGEGCWDGDSCGYSQTGTGQFNETCGQMHCSCVEESRCVANSPAFVPCSACGANGDPPLKELPQPRDSNDMDRCYHMDAFDGQTAHKCHCEQSEAECAATGGYWTDTCIPVCNPDPPSPPQMMGPFNVFEFKTQAAFEACDFSNASTSEFIAADDPSNANDPNDNSNTVLFGSPSLSMPVTGEPVRYFGGSPSSYCQAGQKLIATGGAFTMKERTVREQFGFIKSGISFRLDDWGNPTKWQESGFRFKFMQGTDKIIFDYPTYAQKPEPEVEESSGEGEEFTAEE